MFTAIRVGSQSVAELIARFLFYDVCHAAIAGTDEDHRVVVLDKELTRPRRSDIVVTSDVVL